MRLPLSIITLARSVSLVDDPGAVLAKDQTSDEIEDPSTAKTVVIKNRNALVMSVHVESR